MPLKFVAHLNPEANNRAIMNFFFNSSDQRVAMAMQTKFQDSKDVQKVCLMTFLGCFCKQKHASYAHNGLIA